ncbi:MAG: hypothetical protein K9K67_13615 [Bacteriovoracaceae bacterium]|nr:hypothetical protein [Bacteriovoracaceae bacterium]
MIFSNRLLQATINSLVVHLLLFGCLYLIQGKQALKSAQELSQRAINIESISPEQLKKYRTVGVKGGSKKFSLKTPSGSPVRKKENDAKNSSENSSTSANKSISLDKLQPRVSEKDLPPPPQEVSPKAQQAEARNKFQGEQQKSLLRKEIRAAESGIPLTALRSNQALENFRRQENLKRNMLTEMGTQSSRAEVLSRTGFNLHFEPPEGISEDELNSVEKIFFSFQKRTFTTYVNAFLSTYQQKLLNRPQLGTALKNERHLLTGKIDFDKEGNILKIKILRSSQSDEVHALFEETLKEIRSLPNPPKALIESRDQFTIYYQLSINN